MSQKLKVRVPEVRYLGRWVKPTNWDECNGVLWWEIYDHQGRFVTEGTSGPSNFRYVYEEDNDAV